jgi:acyl carrier protein phosphodiesterase
LNYLAHLFLSNNEPEIMVGNFVADFVRSSQIVDFPENIKKGIAIHHQIDHFTDTHSIVKQSKNRLESSYGRYSSVLVDVFYDHFLALEWHKFSKQDRQEFCNFAYQSLENHHIYLPASLRLYLPEMIANNWLFFYSQKKGVARALANLSQKSKFRKDFGQAIDILEIDYEGFREDFLLFFPQLQQHIQAMF